ncbi:MAG: hypothetical protein WCS72_19010, partial [Deltaproteobacteria bacterium]
NLQLEKDRIETLRTGQFTHTPTPWDAFCQERSSEIFVAESRKQEAFRRILKGSEDLVALLPPAEQPAARDELQKVLLKASSTTDVASARQAAGKVMERARVYNQKQGDKWRGRAEDADRLTRAAEGVKTVCDTSMQFLSMAGGQGVYLAYQGATGYVEGGPLEAVKNTARTYSNAVDNCFTALDGYREGGAQGAATAVATAWLQGKVFETAAGRLFPAPSPGKTKPSIHDQFEAARFKQEAEWGKAQVKQFEDVQAALQKAGQGGASAGEISRLQGDVRKLAISINSSPTAKNVMKYQASAATGRAFDLHITGVYAEVDRHAIQEMRDWQWNMDKLAVTDFRNASSLGTANMDRDFGLNEAATRLLQGRRSVAVTQGGERRSLLVFQGALTKSYHDAYKRVTGYSADSAWQAITTSAHPEAFKDVSVLSGKMWKAKRDWIEQTTDVITYKTILPSLERSNASFSHWTKMQESARGLGKELEKKILPIVEGARPRSSRGTESRAIQERALADTKQYLRDVKSLCDDFGQGRMDPLVFREKFDALTGGKGLTQVASEVGTLVEGIVKFKRGVKRTP